MKNQKYLQTCQLFQKVLFFYGIFTFLGLGMPSVFSNLAVGQGNLLIMPQRVIIEGSKTSEELNLANAGKDTARFVISFIQIRMKDDGRFEKITEPDSGQYFADKCLRIFPRNVMLAPNESQVVKVQLTRANELSPGEYRSHLYFRSVPKENPLGENEVGKDSSISVRLVPIFGITIPAIVRVGESTSRVNITAAALTIENDTMPVINLRFSRSGNMSVYGNVSIDHVSSQGKISHVGYVRGLSIYTPNAQRFFRMSLLNTGGVDYHAGKLHILYTDERSVKPVLLAETDVILY